MKVSIFALIALLTTSNIFAATCQSLFEESNSDTRTGKLFYNIKNMDLILDCKTDKEIVTSSNVIYKGHKRLCVLELESKEGKRNLALFFGQNGSFKRFLDADKLENKGDEHILTIHEILNNGEMLPQEISSFKFVAKELSSTKPEVELKISKRPLLGKKEIYLEANYNCSLEQL